MSSLDVRSAERPAPDRLLTEIADFVLRDGAESVEARRVARYSLMEPLGCGLQALGFPACTKVLGPVVPGATVSGGARGPGTPHELEPIAAA
jgi:2-methylcitrate dehydratase